MPIQFNKRRRAGSARIKAHAHTHKTNTEYYKIDLGFLEGVFTDRTRQTFERFSSLNRRSRHQTRMHISRSVYSQLWVYIDCETAATGERERRDVTSFSPQGNGRKEKKEATATLAVTHISVSFYFLSITNRGRNPGLCARPRRVRQEKGKNCLNGVRWNKPGNRASSACVPHWIPGIRENAVKLLKPLLFWIESGKQFKPSEKKNLGRCFSIVSSFQAVKMRFNAHQRDRDWIGFGWFWCRRKPTFFYLICQTNLTWDKKKIEFMLGITRPQRASTKA